MQRLSLADLDRLLGGDLSPEARAAVEEWRADPRMAEDALDALGWALDASFHIRPRSQDDLLRRASGILERMVQERDGEGHARRAYAGQRVLKGLAEGGGERQILPRWVWSAAVMLFGIVVTVVGWNAGVRRIGRRAAASMSTYATKNGERATIALPDGGTVVLNVASRLEVPTDYTAGNRTVRLNGEALFTVVHNDGKPFTVIAGGTVTRVLGTRFVVRRYGTDTVTMIAVKEGKVAVGPAVLTAEHLMEVWRMGVSNVRLTDGSPFTFAMGVLTLRGLPLSAAILELDRWYDADIRLGTPALASYRLSGEITGGSLAELAENLENALSVRVVQTGRVLTIYPRV